MTELLLELFSEEIPARMQLEAAEQLQEKMQNFLQKDQLYFTSIKSFVTPRRLALNVTGLSLTQENSVVEKKGPKTDAQPAAIEGFLRSTGLKLNQLTVKSTDKGDFYFAIQENKGRKTKDILAGHVKNILEDFYWPKTMRWGNSEIRWIRPLKNIAAVFGGEILPVNFGHLVANDYSYGHRFLAPASFKISKFEDYNSNLEKAFVVLDSAKRTEIILQKANELAKSLNASLVEDQNLLEEVAGLVEYPNVVIGKIEDRFMNLPEEVLISTIRTHQKYFCLRGENGKLAPYFIFVSNIKFDSLDSPVINGNQRVLRARLCDAEFFYNSDLNRPLEYYNDFLEDMVFHNKLGSIAEKISRIDDLSQKIANNLNAHLPSVKRAALLCKSDLATGMVGEFPELQGIMGRYYAIAQNENLEIANAISKHYSPIGASDSCPDDKISICVALSDKIDSLCGLYAAGERATGSKDPYALRRLALGIIRIILENEIHIALNPLLREALTNYPDSLIDGDSSLLEKLNILKKSRLELICEELLKFIHDRLKFLLKSQDISPQILNAVIDNSIDDNLLRIKRKAILLSKFLDTKTGVDILESYKRATNILKIEEKNDNNIYKPQVNKSLLVEAHEIKLFEAIDSISTSYNRAIMDNDFEQALNILGTIQKPLNDFFENVFVNSKDADIRKNRLKLLSQIRDIMSNLADFSLL